MEISNTIKLILLGVLGLFDIICLGLLAYCKCQRASSFRKPLVSPKTPKFSYFGCR